MNWQNQIHSSCKISDTAQLGTVVIEENCEIGDETFIGNFCVLRPNTKIGARTKVGHLTVIEGNCIIGSDCVVQAQCNVTRGVIIEDKVFIAAMVCFSNDKNMTHLRGNWLCEPPIVRYGARIGIGCMILPGVEIGQNSVIGAGSVVTKSTEPYRMYRGVPARECGEVMKDWIR